MTCMTCDAAASDCLDVTYRNSEAWRCIEVPICRACLIGMKLFHSDTLSRSGGKFRIKMTVREYYLCEADE